MSTVGSENWRDEGAMIRIQVLNRSGKEVDTGMLVDEAARFLSLSNTRIRQLASAGDLRRFPIGDKQYAVSRRDVEKYAAEPHKPGPKGSRG